MNLVLRALRLLARLLLVPLALTLPVGAFAVSLGDELILSRLGDPVEVEIEVLQWEDMDLERVQISAASREEYEVFKLTWLPVLEHLNFNLVGPDLDGNVRVLISSRDPLDEPFLELLLVLRWPGGSLRREYVLLFDPPGAPLAVASPADAMREEAAPPEVVAPAQVEATPVVEAPAQVETAPVAEAPAQIEATPVAEAPAPIEATPVAEAPAPIEATPVVEAPPPVEATQVAESSQQVAATRVAEVPPQVETPPVFEAPPPAETAPEIETPLQVATASLMPQTATPEEAPEPVTPSADVVPEPVANPADVAPEPAPMPVARTVPVPEPVAEAGAPGAIPDARTQVAIDVETLAPQAATAPVDMTRRTYQVRSGDSLWNIARQFRPAGAGENLYQMLLGIHDLNRNSFINGNISLLKANALLQMPNEADIAAIDAVTAQAEFDRRWEAGTQRFDAVQRGEAIPLFVNDLPEEAPAAPIEPELPPGTEAPPATADDGGLIMVSSANAALPLQLPLADDGAPVPDVPAEGTGSASTLQTNVTDPAPAPESAVPDAEPELARQIDMVTAAASAAVPTANANAPVQASAPAGTTRVIVTTELETELAAMRARRETAEALARQLQDSLQRAEAERAAQAALLGPGNLPLAGGALALVLTLIAGIVFMLKLAGELRAARVDADVSRVLPRSEPLPSDRPRIASPRRESPRTEPTWTDQAAESSRTPEHRDPADATQIEVVELEASHGASATATAGAASDPDDLFARMDDMLGAAKKSPQK